MTANVSLPLDRIRSAIAGDPQAPAFLGTSTISYRAMRVLVGRTIRMLNERGIQPGQVVALTMSQTPLHIVAFLALARMGANTLAVPPMARESDRAELYRRFEVTAVVSDYADMSAPGLALIELARVTARGDENEFDTWPFEPKATTPLRIGLTSGTTGERQGIGLTHEEFARRMDVRYYGDAPKPRVLPPALHITASLMLAFHALMKGGSVVFPPSYETSAMFDTIGRHAVSHLTFPPVHLAMMLPALKGVAPAFPHVTHLRFLGGTPAPALIEETRRKFTPYVYTSYATTEVGVIAMASPDILLQVPQAAGRVVADAEVQVLGSDGTVLPANAPGEIRVRVSVMPKGYLGDAHPGRFRDGWFYPGDIGYFDRDGLLFVRGRSDDLINLGGRKLAPSHAEEILQEHPGVRECAVFAIDEGRIGAIVVTEGTVDWPMLSTFARSRFDILAPVHYYEVAELPRNALGKIRRRELSALAASGAATLRHTAQ